MQSLPDRLEAQIKASQVKIDAARKSAVRTYITQNRKFYTDLAIYKNDGLAWAKSIDKKRARKAWDECISLNCKSSAFNDYDFLEILL